MRAIGENTITDPAIEQMDSTKNPRLKEIMAAAVRHLHAFAREVDLTPEEWIEGIRFLTATGQMCTAYRQEFILLSDTVGLSSLINSLHDRRATGSSIKSSLLGPFYRQDSPKFELGQSIAGKAKGPEIVLYGRITNAAGKGVPNASVEIWPPDEDGDYDLQKHDPSEMDLRGRFLTNAEGVYYLRTIRPLGYMVPMDGPVGDHIESDTVFGVTDSLIAEVKDADSAAPMKGVPSIRFNFTLAAAKDAFSGRVGADPSQLIRKTAENGH